MSGFSKKVLARLCSGFHMYWRTLTSVAETNMIRKDSKQKILDYVCK